MTALNPKQQNRRQIFWTATLAVVIVSLMTWYDLQHNKFLDMQPPPAPRVGFRFIGTTADVASLPDDGSSLMVWHGTIKLGQNGEAVWSGSDLAPQNFPQRQMDLHVGISDISGDIPTLADHITRAVKAWEVKSNIVSDVYFDVRALALDEAGYDRLHDLITVFRDKTVKTYRVNMIDDPARHAAMTPEKRAALYEDAGYLTLALPADATDEVIMEILKTADGLGRDFRVLAPSGKDPISYLQDEKAKAKHFALMIVGQPPAPKQSENPKESENNEP